jgi:hypothetical protein
LEKRQKELERRQEAMAEALSKRSSGPRPDNRMTTKEAAEMLRVHPKSVGLWRKRRNLPSKKNGRSVVFIRGDVLQWQALQES